MRCGVVVFPGSNCDRDVIHVLGAVLGQEVEELWHQDADLRGCELVVLPGGFSYGDYLRGGALAAPLLLSAALLQATTTIGVGTSVLAAPLHHPLALADREILHPGVGVGDEAVALPDLGDRPRGVTPAQRAPVG